MTKSRNYLEERLSPCLNSLMSQLFPQHQYKSIHDLFNSDLFYKFLLKIMTEDIKASINQYSPTKRSNDAQETYQQMNVNNFIKINEITRKSHEAFDIQLKNDISIKEIQKMVQKYDLTVLQKFIQNVFEIMIRNQKIIMFITTLSEEDQSQIKQFLQFVQQQQFEQVSSIHQLQIQSHLLDSNSMISLQEVESHLQAKQLQIKQERFRKQLLEQQIEQLKSQVIQKDILIENFKKRLTGYEQIDILLLQKDEEILNLNKKITETQIKAKNKESELISSKNKLLQKINLIQSKSLELQHTNQRQKHQLNQLTAQKQQSQHSLKKVISNLKQKNKLFSDKINQIQREIIQTNFQKQLKEKELQQVKIKLEGLNKSNSQGLYRQKRENYGNSIGMQQAFSGLGSPRSQIQQTKQYSNKLGEQISQIQKQSFQQQLSLYTKDESNKRFTQILQQNQNLKHQIQQFISQKNKNPVQGSKQYKQLQEQYQKLKKKLNIMKRRNQQIDTQRKDQIEIMVGVIQEYVKMTG